MKKEVIIYEFGDNSIPIRTMLDEDNNPWFVAKDILDVLKLNRSSISAVVRDHEKVVHRVSSLGGKQATLLVTESGLYRLIFKSKKKEAENFQDWVFEEVLPALRKTGEYRIKRDNIKPGYKEIASKIFMEATTKDKAVTQLGYVANIINQSIIGIKAKECEAKYGLRPRDYVLQNMPDKLDIFDSLQHIASEMLDRGKTVFEVGKAIKLFMGLNS